MSAHRFSVADNRRDTRPDCCRAHVDLANQCLRFAQSIDILEHGVRERREFLAERHRHRVLQLSATHLEMLAELLALQQKSARERPHC